MKKLRYAAGTIYCTRRAVEYYEEFMELVQELLEKNGAPFPIKEETMKSFIVQASLFLVVLCEN